MGHKFALSPRRKCGQLTFGVTDPSVSLGAKLKRRRRSQPVRQSPLPLLPRSPWVSKPSQAPFYRMDCRWRFDLPATKHLDRNSSTLAQEVQTQTKPNEWVGGQSAPCLYRAPLHPLQSAQQRTEQKRLRPGRRSQT